MTITEIVYLLVAFNAVLQIIDVITTNGALNNGAIEANPIVKKSMDTFGKVWWVPKLAVAAGALYASYVFPSASVAVGLAAVGIWYTTVVINNYKLWKR